MAAAAALGFGVAVYMFVRPGASFLAGEEFSPLAAVLWSSPSFFHTVFIGFALLWADARRRAGSAAWLAAGLGAAFEALQATSVPGFTLGTFDPADLVAVIVAAMLVAVAGRGLWARSR